MKRGKSFKKATTTIQGVELYEAETLMEKLRKIKERGENIPLTRETYFTYKQDGPLPGFDIRFDRFAAGQDAAEMYGSYKAQEIAKGQNAPNENNPETTGKEGGAV